MVGITTTVFAHKSRHGYGGLEMAITQSSPVELTSIKPVYGENYNEG